MRGLKHIGWIAFVAIAIAAASVGAAAQVVETSKGSIEFLGLERWTPQMIQERLGYSSPDQLHYCAADLKKIGFPDAVVFAEPGFKTIVVIEPQRAGDIALRPKPAGQVVIPTAWLALRSVVTEQPPAFLSGPVLGYASLLSGADLFKRPTDELAPGWWTVLRSLTADTDYQVAQKAVVEAADPADRVMGTLVLMNFPDRDGTWQSLVGALRDPEFHVNATAAQALNSLRTYLPTRRIDWKPAQADIAAILRGTDVFAFPMLLQSLAATGVDPALASSLLGHGNARLVFAYLSSTHAAAREIAHRFLVQLRGTDLGTAVRPWDEWVQSLK